MTLKTRLAFPSSGYNAVLNHIIKRITYKTTQYRVTAIALLTALLLTPLTHAGSDHKHGDEDHHDATIISETMAKTVGIQTAEVSAVTLQKTTQIYGKVALAPNKVSHLRARFAGVIKNVHATIGDHVKKGDILADIESNESLKRYTLKAPFDGMITARHANAGELIQETPLFTLTDTSQLWAEFSVFPSQAEHVEAGKKVSIKHKNTPIHTVIAHILPSESNQAYIVARAPLPSNTHLTPGLFIEGAIATQTITVALAIDNNAIQTMEGNRVVFVKKGERYEAHALTLGQSDGQYTEVLKGLHAGDEYVTDNSFLVKADIEKSGAEHSH
ncbi:efflux RND transporter periplasmic adaptor subunit [Marinagarivorans algicola]|uniref:efflux RND transporter periplasmic adaptor subunit n=1 Tax=Marinagarivorans algicola TaxID=1513270 RepID=UPI0006B9E085|nr:efflux RND transporter periplasmic adaptor subunit [Marinagarivorans algicola]